MWWRYRPPERQVLQMNYRIVNGKVLFFEGEDFLVRQQDLYIRGGKVSFLPFSGDETFEEVDASDMLVMPGLINMHTHAYMTLMRNYADDVDFHKWLFDGVMPVEDKLDPETAYWCSLLACEEMIRTGTTCFADMHMFCGQSPRAAKEAGMRAFIGRGLVGDDLYGDGASRLAEALSEMEEYERDDMIRFVLSPHAIYSCSPHFYEQVQEESVIRGMLKQTHLSESDQEVKDCLEKYGKTPVQLLSDAGFLDDRTFLAHCVKMQGDDLDIIRESGASIVTNAASNAKLGNGFAPVGEMLKKGINLCIGTDGTASNNTLNMFREMGLLSLIHKGLEGDSTAMPAKEVVRAATVNAGRALGMEGEIGVIKEGAIADLIFLDLDAPSLFPNNNILSSLCYSANGSEVDSVMIEGRFVMRKRLMLTIDTERVRFEVAKAAEKYL